MNKIKSNTKFLILIYHKIGTYPDNTKFPGLYVTEENFDRQIKYLKNKGWTFLTLSELKMIYDAVYSDYKLNDDNGNKDNTASSGSFNPELIKLINKKRRYVSITFDDGSRSVYSNGLKIMKENGVKATVFMVSDLISGVNEWDIKNGENSDEMLEYNDIKELIANGIEIGAHTKTHPHLTQISSESAFNEIISSKKSLEELFKVNINFFAYPYGDYNENIKSLVKEAGLLGACITKTGIVKKDSDFFALKRVAIRHNTDFFKFKRKIFKVRHFY